jgi:hypothetical protein
LELPNVNLLELIQADSNYEELLKMIADALNSNVAPINIPTFNEILQVSANNVVQSENASLKSANEEILPTSFQFQFERNGLLKWPSKAPINASMGFEIKSIKDNKIVYGPFLLDPIKWVFSPTSILSWGIDKFFNVIEGNESPSFKLTNEGDYRISFTNGQLQGSASDDLFQKVKNTNRNAFAVDLFFLVVPLAGKSYLKDCGQKIIDLMFLRAEPLANLIISGSITKGEVATNIYKIGENFIEIIQECKPSAVSGTKFTKSILEQMKSADVLSKAESVSNLISLALDYYGSTIGGEETLHLYDNIAFTELQKKNVSGIIFKGEPESDHQYQSEVKEKSSKYVIERGWETKFTREVTWVEANDLPFNATLIKGDAKIIDSSPFNTLSGNNFCSFQMGKDTSEVKIEPAFKNSEIVTDTLRLFPEKSLKQQLISLSPWKWGEYLMYFKDDSLESYEYDNGELIDWDSIGWGILSENSLWWEGNGHNAIFIVKIEGRILYLSYLCSENLKDENCEVVFISWSSEK